MKSVIKIPKDRVGALIGRNGSELERIEKATEADITVEDSSVTIEGEALNVWSAKEVVRAIGRGFSPVRALRLLEGATLEVVELNDMSGKRLRQVRARVIGRNGRTRELIEELTDTYVSVYGKTVSIIGGEGRKAALEAVDMLVGGARHATVYGYLEDYRSEKVD